MADYVYRRMVRRHWYGRFKYRRRAVIIFILIVVLVAIGVILDLHNSNNKTKPASAVENVQIGDSVSTFATKYFSFQDTGKWVQNKRESSDNKYIYYKFRGQDILYQLIVYVNQVPEPLYLATSRVLPIRIVNNNNFDVTSVSGTCVGSYAAGDLHKIKTVNINGANMLCDPDTPLYTVQLAEIDGDYQLHMMRKDGTPVFFVITFRDMTLAPGPDTIVRIAGSFHSI